MSSNNLGHGHFDSTGKGHHKKRHKSDDYQPHDGGIPGKVFGAFNAFTPMMHSAPITAMATRATTVYVHVPCGSKIYHDGKSSGAECGGCGEPITHKAELEAI